MRIAPRPLLSKSRCLCGFPLLTINRPLHFAARRERSGAQVVIPQMGRIACFSVGIAFEIKTAYHLIGAGGIFKLKTTGHIFVALLGL